MSYLGLHVASSNRPRFSDYLRLSPGSPIPCVVAVDQNVQAEVKQLSPTTMTLWRTKKNPLGADNPPSFMDVALELQPDLARAWMAGLKPLWDKNKHDVLVVNNEQDIGTLDHARKLNAFHVECMNVAERWGVKIGICSFSTGNPSDDGGLTCEQRWQPMLPAIRQCVDRGHYLILHAHADQQKLHFSDTGFRHERAIRFFQNNGIRALRPWIVLGEWSNGVGGVERDLENYMDNVTAWDTAAMHSPLSYQLVGAALYGFNAKESIAVANTPLLDWIARHPGRVLAPEPIPEPEPEPDPASVEITVTPNLPVTVRQYSWLKQITVYAPKNATIEVRHDT